MLGWLVRATVENETKAKWRCRRTVVASQGSEADLSLDCVPPPQPGIAYHGRYRCTTMQSLMLPSARTAPALSAASR